MGYPICPVVGLIVVPLLWLAGMTGMEQVLFSIILDIRCLKTDLIHMAEFWSHSSHPVAWKPYLTSYSKVKTTVTSILFLATTTWCLG